uniref:Uncharacterized protein n=1 Tax=Oryza rufipogon TaxID=4529 RepID=A0A0E0NE57_ORYRU
MGRVDWREGWGTGDGGGDRGSMVDAGIRSSGDDDNLERCVGATAAGEATSLPPPLQAWLVASMLTTPGGGRWAMGVGGVVHTEEGAAMTQGAHRKEHRRRA